MKTNFVGYFDPNKCNVVRLRPWIQFLNEHTLVSHALRLNVPIKTELLRALCLTASIPPNNLSFSFVVQGTTYTVTPRVVNEALGLPLGNYYGTPTPNQLTQFFTDINYQGAIHLPSLRKGNLVSEWELFFDTLIKTFGNCTRENNTLITSFIQYIGYSIAYNHPINIGQHLFALILNRVRAAIRNVQAGTPVQCFYPRFLSQIINTLLTPEHRLFYANSHVTNQRGLGTNLLTRIERSPRHLNVPVVVTQYMSQFIPGVAIIEVNQQPPALQQLPPVEQIEEQAHEEQVAEEQVPTQHLMLVVPTTATGTSVPPQVSSSNLTGTSSSFSTQVVLRTDQGIVEPQSLTQILEPNTESNPQTNPLVVEPENMYISEDDTLRDPVALSPPVKKRRYARETTTSSSISSQQDIDMEMAIKQSLDSLSQQGESIEIRQSAMATCNESSTLPLLTMGEDNPLEYAKDTLTGEHI